MKTFHACFLAALLLAGCTGTTGGSDAGGQQPTGNGQTGEPAGNTGPVSITPNGMASVMAQEPDKAFGVSLVANSNPSNMRNGLMRFAIPAAALACSSPTAILKALPAEDGSLDLVATLSTYPDDSWNQETITWNGYAAFPKGPEIARQTIPAYVSGRDRTITWDLGSSWKSAASDGSLSLVLGHEKANPSDVYYQVSLTTSKVAYQGAYLPTLTVGCGQG